MKQQTLPEALEWLWKGYPIEPPEPALSGGQAAADQIPPLDRRSLSGHNSQLCV